MDVILFDIHLFENEYVSMAADTVRWASKERQ